MSDNNANSSKVVQLFSSEGVPFEYLKLSARIPLFLTEYPPKEGFTVIVDTCDALQLKQGLLQLYETAIKSGRTFEECGLPPYGSHDTVVFTAKLLDKNQQVMSSRTAVKSVKTYKDFESGETAAVQRLFASLGFGGELFDDDESQDFKDQDLTTSPTDTKPEAKQTDKASDNKDANEPPVKASVAKTSVKKNAVKVNEEKKQPEDVPDTIVLQIRQLADMKGLEEPEYKNLKEAKQALKTLQKA